MKKIVALLLFCGLFLGLSEKATAQDSCGVYLWQDTSAIPDLILHAYAYGTPPFTYSWDNGETTPSIEVVDTFSYCVTITDALGCVASGCIVPVVDNPSNCWAGIIEDSTPAGGALIALTGGTGPFQYFWSTGDTTSTIYPDSSGYFCLYVIDATGCVSVESCIYYQVNNPVDSCDVYLDVQVNQNGGVFLIAIASGSPDFNYHWSTGETSQEILVFSEGTYCVTVVDENGCMSEACYYYSGTNPVDSCVASIVALGTGTGETLCAYSTGPGPYTYNWSTGETTFLITVSLPGNYCVTVVDANGCAASTCYYFDGTNPVDSCSVFIEGDSLGINNGIIWAAPTGVAPFSYLWSTGETTQSIQVQVAGEYCVMVVDAVGCETAYCTYAYPFQGVDSCYVTIEAFLDSLPNGSIFLFANTSGNSGYSVLWSTGETSSWILADTIDTYCVTVTYDSGCVATDCYFFDGTGNCSVYIYEDTTNTNSILIADTPANGPAPFTYLWSNGDTSQVISVNTPGTYCVTLTDGSGCQAYDCYTFLGAGQNNICGYVYLADSLRMIGSTTVSLYLLENGGTTLVDEQYFQGEDYFWYYNFTGMADGDYIVKAAIDAGASGADDYVPTYHFSALMWDEADVISVPNNSNFCGGTIIMQPDGGFNGNGNGSVAGNVSDLYGPLAGITILIYDEFGNLLDYLYTDANGEFSFLNLPFGTYQIVIEYTGYNHASYWVTLTDGTPNVEDLTFEVENGAISTGTFETAPANSLRAYPNPVQDLLNIQLDDSWGSDVLISVYNLEGKRLQVWNENALNGEIALTVNNLIPGMYFYQINDGKQIASGKMIKQ